MKVLLGAVAALALSAGVAGAAVIPTTVTPTGTYYNSLSKLNDGVFPGNGYTYNAAESVYFYSSSTTFNFEFGGLYDVTGFAAAVDNNDTYTFTFFDGDTLVGSGQILGSQGSVGYGLETFSRTLAGPLKATRAVLTSTAGDGAYGVGEVQFTGSAVTAPTSGAPEPATWAMMIAGFAGAGAVLRRRSAAVA